MKTVILAALLAAILTACADTRYGDEIPGRNRASDLFACRYKANYERNQALSNAGFVFGVIGVAGAQVATAGPSVEDRIKACMINKGYTPP